MFLNNILSNWEWDIYIKIEYVLCQLHYAQILAREGEKTLFSTFQLTRGERMNFLFREVKSWIILDSNMLIEIS